MSGNWRMWARKPGGCIFCLASSRAARRCFTARRCWESSHWRKVSTGAAPAFMRRSPERWSARWRGSPDIVGGGDAITQKTLLGTQPLFALSFMFLFRFGFSAVSYATATPGGIFAPMLVLGAQLGLIYGRICQSVFPGLALEPVGFAVVGMAAFFTGVVRAPLTEIVLATEMTSNVTLLLPMLGACFAAMLAPSLSRAPRFTIPCASWRWGASESRSKAFPPRTSRPSAATKPASRDFCRCLVFAEKMRRQWPSLAAVERPESISKHQRHDRNARPEDQHMLCLAQLEAADPTDEQVG